MLDGAGAEHRGYKPGAWDERRGARPADEFAGFPLWSWGATGQEFSDTEVTIFARARRTMCPMARDDPRREPSSLTEVISRYGAIDIKDLVYHDDGANLNFLPRTVATFCLDVHARLDACETSGDARRTLAPDVFDLIRRNSYDDSLDPPDDEPLPEGITSNTGWPRITQAELRHWVPEEIYDRFGERWSGVWGAGINLPSEKSWDITDALGDLGISSEFEHRIDQLISWDE